MLDPLRNRISGDSAAPKHGPASLLFVGLFVATAYSGSLYGRAAPYLILAEIAILVWMNLTPIAAERGYVNSRYRLQWILLLVFCGFLAWQATYTMVPEVTLIYLRRFLVFSVLLVFLPNPRTCRLAIKAGKYYGFLVSASILISTWASGIKSGGFVGDYQYGGMMASVACVLFLVDFYHDGGRLVDALGAVLSLIGVFISGKRMFAFIVVISAVWLLFSSVERGKLARLFRLSTMGVLGVGSLYATFEPVRELIGRIVLLFLPAQVATSGRSILWSLALDIFESNRLTGIGFANFVPYSDAISGAPWFGLYHVHNIYLQLLAETGVMGFGIMLGFLGSALVSTWRSYRAALRWRDNDARYILVSSIALQVWFIVYGFSGNGLYGWQEMYLYLSAVAMALSVRMSSNCGEASRLGFRGEST
ncbi:MAG: O-antigen ligase family protein [Anaerosomatales bacterium]|nr:O-antigen ligase family protein [Anaerosomatales bacterium]